MSYLIIALVMSTGTGKTTIFDFSKNSQLNNWVIVNDGVMGGRSTSERTLNTEGNLIFKGNISLENNGGFASIRHRFNKISVANHEKLQIRIKGDGKEYQFRVYADDNDYYSYISYFSTSVMSIIKSRIKSFKFYSCII